MPNGKVGGIAYVKINEVQYPLRGNLKYAPGTLEREEVVGTDGSFHGVKETAKAPYIEMDVTDQGNISLQQLNSLSNATVTAHLNNGKTFILTGAWQMNQLESDASEGQFTVRFVGASGREILST